MNNLFADQAPLRASEYFTLYQLDPTLLSQPVSITPLLNIMPRVSVAHLQRGEGGKGDSGVPLKMFPHEHIQDKQPCITFQMPVSVDTLGGTLGLHPSNMDDELTHQITMAYRTLRHRQEENFLRGVIDQPSPLVAYDGLGVDYVLDEYIRLDDFLPPDTYTPQPYYGILAQLMIEGISAIRYQMDLDDTWQSVLERIAQRLFERGVLTAKVFMHPDCMVKLLQGITLPYDARTLKGGAVPSATDHTELSILLYAPLPFRGALVVPTSLPNNYQQAMLAEGMAPAPWSQATVADAYLLLHKTPPFANTQHFEIKMISTPRVHTPGLFAVIQEEDS